jgi:hypothetical protein
MRFRKGLLCKIAAMALLSAALNAGFAEVDAQKNIELHGFVSMEAGQLVNYKYHSMDYGHRWLQKNLLGLNLSTSLHPRLNINIGIVGLLTYSTMPDKELQKQDNNVLTPISGLLIDRADILLNLSPQVEDSLLKIGIGIFPYKYNNDVRDLGEYLFRTGCYPGYINQNGFDAPFAQLAGIRLSSNLFGFLHEELFLTSELYLPPFNDFSVTYIADVSLVEKVIDFGAGIQFFRCFSADKNLTQPENSKAGLDYWPAPNYYNMKLDSIGVDTNTLMTIYDTTASYYTFAGTKLMARLSIDPKPLFSDLTFFGPEDLKIYSEVAILGLKNYPANKDVNQISPVRDSGGMGSNSKLINEYGYDTLLQKMPIMVGINIPTFKLLDVLSFEIEYYAKKYVNSVPIPAGNVLNGEYYPTNPFPYSLRSDCYYTKTFYEQGVSQWKWAVYAKKTMLNRFSITGQAARDHMRMNIQGVSTGNLDKEDALVKSKHWYWMLKFGANF